MFSSRTNQAKSGRDSQAPTIPSLLAADLKVNGDLETEGELQIDGVVDGDVKCGRLLIGEEATVTGEVTADNVTVRGQVTGRIHAKTVQLSKSAKVIGDIWHESLAIDAGAYLDGHCRHMDGDAKVIAHPAEPAAAKSGPELVVAKSSDGSGDK